MRTIANAHGVGTRPTAQAAVTVGALGVVFGDIGTSPIYTVQTVFNPDDPHPVPVSTDNVYGVVSLIFWSVMIIVTLNYVLLVMRADNDGEGGIMALITLLRRGGRGAARRRAALVLAGLGIFGASLFFGDSMITPAISVLSAVEGLKVVEPALAKPDRADHRGDHRRAVRRAAARHRGRRPAVRPGDDRLVRGDRRVRRRRHRRPPGDPARRCHPPTRWASWPGTSASPSSRWPRSCSRSPAPRRCTPTWVISAGGRSPAAGSVLVLPACMLSYFGQGALLLGDPAQRQQPVLPARARAGRGCRWCCSPPRPR